MISDELVGGYDELNILCDGRGFQLIGGTTAFLDHEPDQITQQQVNAWLIIGTDVECLS